MYDDTPLVMIEDDEHLARACADWMAEKVLGIDTESDSMHSYREKVCLIQVSDTQRDYIIDPFSITDMSPLGEVMASPTVVKVFHGADYDVVSLKRDFGFTFVGLFDTMVAAQLLGLPKVGLADLCRRFFAAELDKKYQTHDWSRRPLLPEHLEYARGDTHYLAALREVLSHKLQAKKRMDILDEECAILARREWTGAGAEAAWRYVKGLGRLSDPELRVVRAVYELRDGHARSLNRPPYKVFPDQIIKDLATTQPQTLDELHRLGRPGSSMFRRYGHEMLDAVKRGLADDREIPELPSPKKKRRATPSSFGSRETERLANQLKGWRSEVRRRDGVPLAMVASNSQLIAIAGQRPTTIEALAEIDEVRDWQVRRYGPELIAEVQRFEGTLDRSEPAARRSRRRRRR